jgi:hypothetical protein
MESLFQNRPINDRRKHQPETRRPPNHGCAERGAWRLAPAPPRISKYKKLVNLTMLVAFLGHPRLSRLAIQRFPNNVLFQQSAVHCQFLFGGVSW